MAKRAARQEECPHCGATFAAGRLACPECGSDAGTGWKSGEEIDYQSVDLPDDPYAPASATGRRGVYWLALVAALIAALVIASW